MNSQSKIFNCENPFLYVASRRAKKNHTNLNTDYCCYLGIKVMGLYILSNFVDTLFLALVGRVLFNSLLNFIFKYDFHVRMLGPLHSSFELQGRSLRFCLLLKLETHQSTVFLSC